MKAWAAEPFSPSTQFLLSLAVSVVQPDVSGPRAAHTLVDELVGDCDGAD
jgi:hypothetical protein